VLNDVRDSPDPRKTAFEWRGRLANLENGERRMVRKRAVEALGEIGTLASLVELVKLTMCEEGNLDMWAAGALNRAASENPKEILPVLKRMAAELEGRDDTEKVVQILGIAYERAAGKA